MKFLLSRRCAGNRREAYRDIRPIEGMADLNIVTESIIQEKSVVTVPVAGSGGGDVL